MVVDIEEDVVQENFRPRQRSRWFRRPRILLGLFTSIILIIVAVTLGVELSKHSKGSNSSSSSTSSSDSSSSMEMVNGTVPAGIWQPTNGTTWQYELLYALNDTSLNVDVWDIDLFDNTNETVQELHDKDSKVICYFSAGSYENWRPDANEFEDSDLGNSLDGWPGEKWVNVRSDNVRNIMVSRLDLAVSRGCDGVDPDNVDGYDNDNGLDLTEDDAIEYMQFLANAAQSKGLSIGLKNAGSIVENVIDLMQWSVQEQCHQYDECDLYTPFIDQGKPVFNVEYPKGDTNDDQEVSSDTKTSICDESQQLGLSTIIKNLDLDNWIESCTI